MSNNRRLVAPDFEERYPDANPIATEGAMNLVRTADLLVKRIAKLLEPYQLTPSAGLALSILADAEKPLSPNQIAEKLIISRAAMTSLLDSLAKHGYAQRTPHPTDRRRLLVMLTDQGRRVADEFRPLIHRYQKEWFDVLSAGQQQELVETLQALQERL